MADGTNHGTVIVGIAGVIGTLLGGIVAPIVAEVMRRRGAHRDRLADQRLLVDADVVRAGTKIVDNAATWAAIPTVDLPETSGGELDAIVARLRVVASERVLHAFGEFSTAVTRFNRALVLEVRPLHEAVRESGVADTEGTMRARGRLADLAERVAATYRLLEAAIRAETSR